MQQAGIAAHRPLKSRATAWAGWLAGLLVRSGVSPNTVSVFSVVSSVAAGGVMLAVATGVSPRWGFLLSALLVHMRLVCNLMDGMVAIEGRKKKPLRAIISMRCRIGSPMCDSGRAGMCALSQPLGVHLGGLASALAMMTACIRMQGALLTGRHDFRGSMAKP